MKNSTLATLIKTVNKTESASEYSLINNYDKVYAPLFAGILSRQKAFDSYKGKDGANKNKLDYDIKQGLRNDKGDYLLWSLSEISQFGSFAILSKDDFVSLVQSFIDSGKSTNTLKTLYKNVQASKRAAQNKGEKPKSKTAQKAAKTREKNLSEKAMIDLVDGFEIGKIVVDIIGNENYGAMTVKDIEMLTKKLLSAMLKDNAISENQKANYDSLKKTA